MPKKTHSKKILLLEDEKALADFYANRLKEAGYQVEVFTSTKELLSRCETYKPDMAFVDHTLAGSEQSGTEAVPILRKCNPDMRIIMLTNYSEFQMKDEAEKAGADDYLLKINTPPDILVAYVERHS